MGDLMVILPALVALATGAALVTGHVDMPNAVTTDSYRKHSRDELLQEVSDLLTRLAAEIKVSITSNATAELVDSIRRKLVVRGPNTADKKEASLGDITPKELSQEVIWAARDYKTSKEDAMVAELMTKVERVAVEHREARFMNFGSAVTTLQKRVETVKALNQMLTLTDLKEMPTSTDLERTAKLAQDLSQLSDLLPYVCKLECALVSANIAEKMFQDAQELVNEINQKQSEIGTMCENAEENANNASVSNVAAVQAASLKLGECKASVTLLRNQQQAATAKLDQRQSEKDVADKAVEAARDIANKRLSEVEEAAGIVPEETDPRVVTPDTSKRIQKGMKTVEGELNQITQRMKRAAPTVNTVLELLTAAKTSGSNTQGSDVGLLGSFSRVLTIHLDACHDAQITSGSGTGGVDDLEKVRIEPDMKRAGMAITRLQQEADVALAKILPTVS